MRKKRNRIVFKPGSTGKTGRLLRDTLSISSQLSYKEGEPCPKVIRWGNSERIVPGIDVLNKTDSIANASNKLKALQIMKEEGVRVPWFTESNHTAQCKFVYDNVKLVGRTSFHQGGSGFCFCSGSNSPNTDHNSTHWLEYIKKEAEYRVHVFGGDVIGVSRKYCDNPDAIAWNHSNGSHFSLCDMSQVSSRLKELAIEAVEALELDFGAVDIILSDGSETTAVNGGRTFYVLEVNSAPSLEEGSTIFNNYIERFRRWLQE